jgi:hypothetical protein
MSGIDREVQMPTVDADHGLECRYDVHELPSFEEYDTDFASYRQAFAAEMNRWVRQGYEVIGVASHSGRLLGFFKKTAGKPVK